MSYKLDYEMERRWDFKCLIISVYHHMHVIKNPHHRQQDTADYFCKSLATISEDLKIARALHDGLQFTSRNDAIKRINGRRK